jgi:hypothetical protein
VLSWIASFIGRWSGTVSAAVRDMVHWAVHALASVVYTVFGNVGKAWHEMWAAASWLETAAGRFATSVYDHLRAIVVHDIPLIYAWALKWIRAVEAYAVALYHWAARELGVLRALAWSWILDVRAWALRDIWDPLHARTDQIWQDLLKWGYTAWWYLNHPAAFVAIIGDAITDWLEANAWATGRKLGTFALALMAHNMRRLLALAEDIVTAVL